MIHYNWTLIKINLINKNKYRENDNVKIINNSNQDKWMIT